MHVILSRILNQTVTPKNWQGGLDFSYGRQGIQMDPNDTRYAWKNIMIVTCNLNLKIQVAAKVIPGLWQLSFFGEGLKNSQSSSNTIKPLHSHIRKANKYKSKEMTTKARICGMWLKWQRHNSRTCALW